MVNAIIAMSNKGRIIGNGDSLPWHIPGDLQFFKNITMGSTVVMGRKTWDSLPESVRPLPGRKNIVVSRSKDVSGNPDQVMTLGEFNFMPVAGEMIYVIGGAEIIEKTLSMTKGIHLTRVYGDFEGDKKMPQFEHLFAPQIIGRMRESNGIKYRHERWIRL